MKLIVAFSTSDGKTLIDAHFGDAESFPVYEISKDNVKFIKSIDNSTEEDDDEIHGDPKKAQGISQIMKPHGVQILCGKQFGLNITRMVKNFVPVLINLNSVDEAITLIQNNFEKIQLQWEKGENRKHLRIK